MDLNAGRHDPERELASLLREPRLLATPPENPVNSLLEAADRHGVLGLLLGRAIGTGISLHPLWMPLRERVAGQSAAAALRDAEALEVLRRAQAAELDVVVLKGLALAHTVYPHPWARERRDTDLLVRESDVPRFDRFFEGRGYTLLPHVRGDLTLPQRHYHRDDDRGFRHAWDLHWRVTSSQVLRHALPEEELWARAEPLAALGNARIPSRPDALLHACIHRLAHHYDDPRLIWLWDIRLLLESMTATEVEMFARLAGRLASAAACGHSLEVARELAGAAIPDGLQPLLDSQPHSTASFLWSGSRRRITYFAGELRAARTRDRFKLLRERVLPPLSSMRERYRSVPRALLPFMYIWRLILGVPKWIRAR